MRGLRCKNFAKELLGGCKPGFKSYYDNYVSMTLETRSPHIARRLITDLRVRQVRVTVIITSDVIIGFLSLEYPSLIV